MVCVISVFLVLLALALWYGLCRLAHIEIERHLKDYPDTTFNFGRKHSPRDRYEDVVYDPDLHGDDHEVR
jgi:hypothetical protein